MLKKSYKLKNKNGLRVCHIQSFYTLKLSKIKIYCNFNFHKSIFIKSLLAFPKLFIY